MPQRRDINARAQWALADYQQSVAVFERDATEAFAEDALAEFDRLAPRNEYPPAVELGRMVNRAVDFAVLAFRELCASLILTTRRAIGRLLQDASGGIVQERALPRAVSPRIFRPMDADRARGLVDDAFASRKGALAVFKLKPRTSARVRSAMTAAFAAGQPPREAIEAVRDIIGSARQYEAFTRTAIQDVNNRALDSLYRDNRDVLHGAMYQSLLDDRTCLTCAGYDGREYWHDPQKGEASYADRPGVPVHVRCLLPGAEVTARGAVAATTARYSGPAILIRTASGRQLAVTPHHQLLGAQGFIAAQSLRKGNYLVRTTALDRVIPRHPDYDHGPASIEDVIGALAVAQGMRSTVMPVSAEDFHGDAVLCDSQIHVIWSDRLVVDNAETTAFQHSPELPLCAGWDKSTFERLGDLDAMLVGLGLAAHGQVCRCRQSPALLDHSIRHANVHGIAAVARRIARQDHGTTQAAPADPKPLGCLLQRFASLVALDEIVDVERFCFSGHVHDLQTESGLYIANGLLSSNCRCYYTPMVKSLRALGIRPKAVAPKVARAMKGRPTPGLTYAMWLAKQSASSQRAVLGKPRYELYQRGMPVDRFTAAGQLLTIDDLPLAALSRPRVRRVAPPPVTATARIHATTGMRAGEARDVSVRANVLLGEAGLEVSLVSNPRPFVDRALAALPEAAHKAARVRLVRKSRYVQVPGEAPRRERIQCLQITGLAPAQVQAVARQLAREVPSPYPDIRVRAVRMGWAGRHLSVRQGSDGAYAERLLARKARGTIAVQVPKRSAGTFAGGPSRRLTGPERDAILRDVTGPPDADLITRRGRLLQFRRAGRSEYAIIP